MQLVLITGGARAGKSRHAQARAEELAGSDVTYVATALVADDEMRTRVARHREERPAVWRTIEAPTRVGSAILEAPTRVVLLDCLTMVAANALERRRPRDAEAALGAVTGEVDDLLAVLPRRDGTLIVVTNEVGLAVHPPTALGRWFQDALGFANQRLAREASEVTLMVSGIPVPIKPSRQHDVR